MGLLEAREENPPFPVPARPRAGTQGTCAVVAVGQMPSQTTFLIIFQIILWQKAAQAAARADQDTGPAVVPHRGRRVRS